MYTKSRQADTAAAAAAAINEHQTELLVPLTKLITAVLPVSVQQCSPRNYHIMTKYLYLYFSTCIKCCCYSSSSMVCTAFDLWSLLLSSCDLWYSVQQYHILLPVQQYYGVRQNCCIFVFFTPVHIYVSYESAVICSFVFLNPRHPLFYKGEEPMTDRCFSNIFKEGDTRGQTTCQCSSRQQHYLMLTLFFQATKAKRKKVCRKIQTEDIDRRTTPVHCAHTRTTPNLFLMTRQHAQGL